MSDLLIHSMAEFAPLIEPVLEMAEARDIAEIGSEFGGMSRILAERCAATGGTLTCIDPTPMDGFASWAADQDRVRHIALPSLDAFDALGGQDAWVVDGDHNYHTVSNELAAIDAICAREGRPLLVFLHDVSWPCARRDMYYAPQRIPEDARQPFDYDAGVVPGHAGALAGAGMRGMGQFAWALREGGPRNGVLTAIEDFLARADSEARPLYWVQVPGVFGLGAIFDATAPWAEEAARFLLPFHRNPLLERLEANRLANWLKVIEFQDRDRAA